MLPRSRDFPARTILLIMFIIGFSLSIYIISIVNTTSTFLSNEEVDRRLIMNESPFPHEYLKMWPELRSDDHTDDTFRFTTLELMGPQSLSPTMLPTSSAVYSTVSFYYTGSEQIYAVPNGVTSITVDMAGGAGGSTVCSSSCPSSGGLGGRIVTKLSVTGGQNLYVYVGGAGYGGGGGGFNGGGGGGSSSSLSGAGGGGCSDIRTFSTDLSTRLAVAAGGGGAGAYMIGDTGGAGGGSVGQTLGWMGGGGTGGSQTAGGTGSDSGRLGYGGMGFGVGAGGGGCGLYGGGGGIGKAGGGGSSSSTGAIITNTQGYQSGNGYVIITAWKNPAILAPPITDSNSAQWNLVTSPTGYVVTNSYMQNGCGGAFIQQAYGVGVCQRSVGAGYSISITANVNWTTGMIQLSSSSFLNRNCTGPSLFAPNVSSIAPVNKCTNFTSTYISAVSPPTFISPGAVIAMYMDSACSTKLMSYTWYPTESCFLLDSTDNNTNTYALVSCNATSGRFSTFKDARCLSRDGQSYPPVLANQCTASDTNGSTFFGQFQKFTCIASYPTSKPVAAPSSTSPSPGPSSIPVARPTANAPSSAPTRQTVPVVKFSSQISMQGLSTPSLPDASVAVVLEVTAAMMEIPTSAVTFAGVTFNAARKLATGTATGRTADAVSPLVRGQEHPVSQVSQPHLRVLGGFSAVVAVNVAIQASLFPAASSLSDIYSTVTSALSTAAANGQFTAALKAAAARANVTSLAQVTVSSATSTAPVIAYPPTLTPTEAPKGSTLALKYIIIIVVVGFVVLLMLAKGIHYAITGSSWPFSSGHKEASIIPDAVGSRPAEAPASADSIVLSGPGN